MIQLRLIKKHLLKLISETFRIGKNNHARAGGQALVVGQDKNTLFPRSLFKGMKINIYVNIFHLEQSLVLNLHNMKDKE